MLIESILRRKGGTLAALGGVTYHFVPSADYVGNPHIADVTNDAHIHRFLSLPEGYRAFLGGTPISQDATGLDTVPDATGLDTVPAVPTAPASTSSAKPSGTNSQSKGNSKGKGKDSATVAAVGDTPTQSTSGADKEARAAAISDYFAKFGKEPDEALTTADIVAAVSGDASE